MRQKDSRIQPFTTQRRQEPFEWKKRILLNGVQSDRHVGEGERGRKARIAIKRNRRSSDEDGEIQGKSKI